MYKKIIIMKLVLLVVLVIFVVTFVSATGICASPIQEEQTKKADGANIAETSKNTKSASPDNFSEENMEIAEDSLSDMEIIDKYERLRLYSLYDIMSKRRLNEYLDRFPEISKTLQIPLYTLAEDFPQDHVKTFNDFLIFCASVVAPHIVVAETHLDDRGYLYGNEAYTKAIYEHPLVKMRLELNNPVRYEDFLAAVLLSLCCSFRERYFENHDALCAYYIRMFMSPTRNSFFEENILLPLSHDLAYGKYRGYRFKNINLPQFIREFADNCFDIRMEVVRRDSMRGYFGLTFPPYTLVLPEEFHLLNYYAQTFLLILKEELNEAYKELYRYKTPINSNGTIPPRPYYYYSDDDRYHWFEYLHAELRSAGHSDYADSILETEIEHYRELIVWQLQLRAYLVEKLFEYGDSSNLSTLTELLTSEYESLKNAPIFQAIFKNAIEKLRDMDEKVRAKSLNETGDIALPWIDREAIDSKQGIESKVLAVQQNPITWKIAIEDIDGETKEEMKNLYEKVIYYIRVLAVISERLNQERELATMVQLHSILASNTNVNCTPTGIFHPYFSYIININSNGEKKQTFDSQTAMYQRFYQYYESQQRFPMRLPLHEIYRLYVLNATNKDIEDISEIVLIPQVMLDLRRYDLIVNDFWGHYSRRKNGDMSVGEIILPWVEVQDK